MIFHYTIHNHVLEEVSSTKYLDVKISHDITWTKHIDNPSAKANSKLGLLCRNIKTKGHALKEQAYNTIVRPTVAFCSTV